MRKFTTDRKGNVAILFALALIPVIGAMGAAVDYSTATAQRTAMQAAIDATALALAKIMPASQSELDARGQEFFNANLGTTPVTNVVLTIVPSTGKLNLSATGYYQPKLVNVLGVTQFPIGARAEVKWGGTRLRVALVLDVTGSMNSAGKLTALKSATNNLLVQLKSVAAVNDDVYVSIIPFSKDVAVDPAGYNVSWIRWDDGTDSSWDGTNGTCSKSGYSPRSSCVAQGTCNISGNNTKSSCQADGVCSKSQYTSKSSCQSHSGTWTKGKWTAATWTPKSHSTWNGCITDRDQDYDTKNTAPSTSTAATLFPAEQYSSCPDSTVIGLTYDWVALKSKVDTLMADGNTNQAIGLQWGWQTLTSAPFLIPAFDSKYKYQQIIILLTDGLNTQNRWTSTTSQIDARESITCNNVKAGGIILYTIQVNTDNDPTSTLLQNCASDSKKFFLLTSGSQIVATFNQIAMEISSLRLSQ